MKRSLPSGHKRGCFQEVLLLLENLKLSTVPELWQFVKIVLYSCMLTLFIFLTVNIIVIVIFTS